MAGIVEEHALKLLDHYFKNSSHADIGSALGLQPSSPAGNFWIALHTAPPTESGASDPTSSEVTYFGYSRQPIGRSGPNWTSAIITGGAVIDNTTTIQFGTKSGGGTHVVTHYSAVTSLSGAGELIVFGNLDSTLSVTDGMNPEFTGGQCNFQAV